MKKRPITWGLIGLVFGVIVVLLVSHIYTTRNPPPRLKSAGLEVSVDSSGKIAVASKYEFNALSDPRPGSLKSDTSPYKEIIESTRALQNVAKAKPVSYLGKQLILRKESEGQQQLKLWDRDKYYQWQCVNSEKYDYNLTDGEVETVAYPGSWYLDYIIDLKQIYMISKVVLVWGGYGEDRKYITSWKLYGQKEFNNQKEPAESDWMPLKSGEFPNTAAASFELGTEVRRFRLTAESIDPKSGNLMEWIGIFEFEAYTQPGAK